jgi:hypothetical protein
LLFFGWFHPQQILLFRRSKVPMMSIKTPFLNKPTASFPLKPFQSPL